MSAERGEGATPGDEDEADRVNAGRQPDWEEVAFVAAEVASRRSAGTLDPGAVAALRARMADAVPEGRPELLSEFEALLASGDA